VSITAPAVQEIRAGRLSALLDGVDLRYLRIGDTEIVRRIYMAVRDEVWNTIPGRFSDVVTDIGPDRFSVSFKGQHRYQSIDYSWSGRLEGTADGVITCSMDGTANGAFRYCKIGFNVHHPPQERGHAYVAHTPDGDDRDLLPELIEPQRLVAGTLTALGPPYDALTIEHEPGLTVRFTFAGDLVEMQDHRNWTDSNYKSYFGPLAIPWPMDAHKGQRMLQSVTIWAEGEPASKQALSTETRIEIEPRTTHRLPAIGLGMPSHGRPNSARETAQLGVLRPDHIRADLYLDSAASSELLRRARDTAQQLGSALELAVFLTENAQAELRDLAAQLKDNRVRVARVLVFYGGKAFSTGTGATPGRWVELARQELAAVAPQASFAGGTNQFFAEINRGHPEIEAMDAVVYSINPQVHACDSLSLVENLAAQADTVATARSFCGNRAIVISPVTLAARNGPYPAGPPVPDSLPPAVDVRQLSLLAAGWTAASIKYLAESGVESVTYYETTGWRGVIEADEGSPRPDRFPSKPGQAFPMYHVFADVAQWKGAGVLPTHSSEPLVAEALAVRHEDRVHVIVANLTSQPQRVSLGPFTNRQVQVRLLDPATAPGATTAPASFRSSGTRRPVESDRVVLSLAPYAVARLDET
jgi:hypothetical protein